MTICIIALLASLTLPAINRALSAATRTKCANNLRQLAVATVSYAADHKMRAPYPRILNNGEPSYVHTPHFYSVEAYEATLESYLGDRFAHLYCPGALSRDPNGNYNPAVQRKASTPNDFVSYQYFNSDKDGAFSSGHPKPEYNLLFKHMMETSQNYAMWGCLTYVAGTRTFGHEEGRANNMNPKGMNAAFADGSVRWVPFHQLESFSSDGAYLWPAVN